MTDAASLAGDGLGPDGKPDPTKNVLDLVAAGVIRQDDLREWLEKYVIAIIDGRVAITDERYESLKEELKAVEARRIEHKNDTKGSVDTAFGNAEKAIAKSEAAQTEKVKAVESTVSDLKDRVVTLEATARTKGEAREDNRGNIGMWIGIAGFALAFLVILVSVVVFMNTSPRMQALPVVEGTR